MNSTVLQNLPAFAAKRHPVPDVHPRLLGPLHRLRQLALQRPEAYDRMRRFALHPLIDTFEGLGGKIIGLAIVYAVEGLKQYGREAVDLVLQRYVDQPTEVGHVPFASSVARGAIAYDLCHDLWTPDERARYCQYLNRTVDANVESEPSVFHNGWYGYKHWGCGLGAYATYHENPRAPEILRNLEKEYIEAAAPALAMAGEGGGWAEGFYVHFWLNDWLFFCEVARKCEGVDYYALAPGFYANRAIAGMFEMYPGIRERGSRRQVPMGDGAGRFCENDRDRSLTARRILVNYYRHDPAHQAVHAFNLQTPCVAWDHNAYEDLLWADPTVPAGDLDSFKLSHYSPGAGFVYARSSWKEDATYLFFHCGRRFTTHQHLDNGHFVISRREELLGDGGHYDDFNTDHVVNYYLRTIAHNAILVHDPDERWPMAGANHLGMRGGPPGTNDGGQAYPWVDTPVGHNGSFRNIKHWLANRALSEIGRILTYEDRGAHVHIAADSTASYSAHKVEYVTRQIVFLRPGTFVIFDRVKSRNAQFRKTFLLQAMKTPERVGDWQVITHGMSRLFVQTLLPVAPQVHLAQGATLYTYGGQDHPPLPRIRTIQGPGAYYGRAPECRVEISPAAPSEVDYFLHVLTATDANVQSVPRATARSEGGRIGVSVGQATMWFETARVNLDIEMGLETSSSGRQ